MRRVDVVPGRHYTAVVIGGGQAGLAMSHHLLRLGVDHLVIERDEVAHEWRDGRWDKFTLVTPNWHCRLPGWPYAGPDPDGFMTRDEVHAWVRGYAESFEAPVAERTAVTGVRQRLDGGFEVETTAGTLTASTVTVATGGYHVPVVPGWAGRLPQRVHQIHSHQYRNADQLPEGEVLVIGSGQSGTQIAEDLMLEGRQVHLAIGRAPRVARFYRGRDCMTWLADMGIYDRPVGAQHAAKRESTNHYVTGRDGGRDIDLRAFARDGMRLYGRAVGFEEGALRFAPTLAADLDHADSVAESIKDDIDAHIAREGIQAPPEPRYTPVWEPAEEPEALELSRISAVIWSIGFRADYSWLKVDVFDDSGRPKHVRGLTEVPGLAFVGLPWLHTWGSGRFLGIAEDTGYVAETIAGTAGRTGQRAAGGATDQSAPQDLAAVGAASSSTL